MPVRSLHSSVLRWPDRETVVAAARDWAARQLAERPELERGRDWDLTDLPVPAEILLYPEDEWREVVDRGDRFAGVMSTEVVWLGARD